MTGSALAIRPAATTALTTIPDATAGMSFADMVAMGDALVATRFLPEHIKSGAQAAAIILTGRELGMAPMRAIRSLVMVKGKVTETADSQLARFKTDGGRAVFEELSATRAVLKLRHPNGDEHTETFTLEDAQKAGLAGAGSMYQKYAKPMLRSRVITAGLKSLGWEGGSGVYDPGEFAAGAAVDTETGEVLDAPLTMDDASALVINGVAIGDCRNTALRRTIEWAREKLAMDEGNATLTRIAAAAKMVLAAREAGDLVEPPKKGKPDMKPTTAPESATPSGAVTEDDDLPF